MYDWEERRKGLGTIGLELGQRGSEEKEESICLPDWEGRGRTSYLRAPMQPAGSLRKPRR